MNHKILVVGPTFLDIQVFLKNIHKGSIKNSFSIGGKGYNIARNLTAFNIQVDLATMYGSDDTGEYIAKQLATSGIGLLPENKLEASGGVFVGVHDSSGNSILDKADTSMFPLQKLSTSLESYTEIIVLSSTNTKILNYIKSQKSKFSFTLCLEFSGKKTINHIMPYLDMFDFIIANKEETEALLQISTEQTSLTASINAFSQLNKCILITTIDKDGIIVSKNGESFTHPIHKLQESLVSTVGAGDSVTASIVALHYHLNYTLDNASQKAMEMAAYMVRQPEPYFTSLPTQVTF